MDIKTGKMNGGAVPLPQRQKGGPQGPNVNAQKNQQQNQANKAVAQQPPVKAEDGAPAEKKARFNNAGPQNGGPVGNQNQRGGFGGGNKGGFQNRNRMNQNQQNRGNQNQQNRGNFPNQNQNQPTQPQNQQANQQNDVKMAEPAAKVESKEAVPKQQQTPAGGNPNQQNQQNHPNQNQQQNHPNQNQQQNHPNQNQQQNQNQQHMQNQQHNQNRGGNRGGPGGQGGFGGNRNDRNDRGGDRNDRNNDRNMDRNERGDRNDRNDRNRDRSRGGRGGQGNQGGPGRGDEFFIGQRLRAISGPTHELPPIETSVEETKFSGRNRLYLGNLTNDCTEEELRELFKPYGEVGEVFHNAEKNFCFLKVDYHANAEKAKRELDGMMRKGRPLRVRFAPNATILRIKNLTPFVSNELLYKSFEVFGPVERAQIIVDDRGKHTGEGIVEFGKKQAANACLRLCNEKCYFLTASLRPCVVEPFDINDDNDGLPERQLNKKTQEFNHERSMGPRFADLGSFEHEYGTRWKQLHELFKTKQEALKRELKMEEDKLEAQMEYARYEHETELLRQELRKRESDNERKKMEWEMREKQNEEMRQREEENMRRQQTEMQARMLRQEEEMRRRQQENTLFMQAQQLNNLLDQQEGFTGGNNFDNFPAGPGGNNSPFDFRGNNPVGGGGNNNGPNNPQDSFPFEFGGNNQNQQGGNSNQGNRGNNNNSGGNNNPWERRRRF